LAKQKQRPLAGALASLSQAEHPIGHGAQLGSGWDSFNRSLVFVARHIRALHFVIVLANETQRRDMVTAQ
jgi:hypothetical protein